MRTILKRKTVEVNEFSREVGIVIQDNLMYGYINKTRFVWNYTVDLYPSFKSKQSDPVKSAKYGRLYILGRLKLADVNLNIKTIEKTVPYVSLSKKDGVWINCFSNGYLRGQINGVSFVWHPGKYKRAVAANPANNSAVVDTNLIIKRIRQAGCNTMAELMEAVEKHTGVKYTGPVSFSQPESDSSKPVQQPVQPIEDSEQTIDLDPIEVDMICGDFSRPSEEDIRRLSMVYDEEPVQEEELEETPILIASGDKFEVGLTPDGKFVGTNNGKPFCCSALSKLPKRVKDSIYALGYTDSKSVKAAFLGRTALRVSYSPIVDDCSSVLQACLCFNGRPLVSDDIA